jgi:ribosomal subunit interface protein
MATAMQVPLQIAFHNLECSDAIKELIEERVAWLERYYDRVISCRVVVEEPHRHHRQGNLYRVRIDLTVPGAEIVVSHEPPEHPERRAQFETLDGTIRHAFDNARRKLEEHVRRHRNEVKSHDGLRRARVSQLFGAEGYGFLATTDGREVFFHRNAVLNGGFDELKVGTEVSFAEEPGDKGPQASTVRTIGRHNHS